MKYFFIFSIFSLSLCLYSCGNLEQEVEIDLPAYDSRIVLECYLEAGQPYYLLLTRSSPYFETFPVLDNQFLENILEEDAEIIIEHNGQEVKLENTLGFNFNTNKLYNYTDTDGALVPENFEGEFSLSIVAKDGTTVTGSTKILPMVPIDSVVVQFNDSDTLARVLTYFTDRPNESNFYRRLLHESSLDSLPRQDFTIDDRVVEDVVVFGTNYNFEVGDTVINSIYHIEESYYDYLESIQIAIDGNFNPFGQPSPINSSLGGTANALGIFTGLAYDRKAVIIDK